ncbi:hypothetical protein J2T57_001446 [Natronocella acetinitrilica]|uniref:Uncharacterized protein n=1 Tax=Natronocella acetinitrilica TaxID=414046 RepID=A0AAE3KB41_9GAMM|nr:hypothetical protein [Natronocella acetinitrilica]MCP1674344.1 hypothetical protein [Natronocella acetinitrilica]
MYAAQFYARRVIRDTAWAFDTFALVGLIESSPDAVQPESLGRAEVVPGGQGFRIVPGGSRHAVIEDDETRLADVAGALRRKIWSGALAANGRIDLFLRETRISPKGEGGRVYAFCAAAVFPVGHLEDGLLYSFDDAGRLVERRAVSALGDEIGQLFDRPIWHVGGEDEQYALLSTRRLDVHDASVRRSQLMLEAMERGASVGREVALEIAAITAFLEDERMQRDGEFRHYQRTMLRRHGVMDYSVPQTKNDLMRRQAAVREVLDAIKTAPSAEIGGDHAPCL